MEKLKERVLSKLIHKKPIANTPSEEIVVPEEDIPVPGDQNNQKIFIFGCISFVVICLLTGLMFYLKSQNSNNNTSTQPIENKIESSSSASLSNQESLNKSDWTFEVLNGSGVAGAAKSIANKIQNLGYTVVKTGNADKNNYPNTLLLIAETSTQSSVLLLKDLNDNLGISTISGTFNDSAASARIIVGKQ